VRRNVEGNRAGCWCRGWSVWGDCYSGFSSTDPQPAKSVTKWEYKVLSGYDLLREAPTDKEWHQRFQEAYDRLGNEGWELVTVTKDDSFTWFYFKRQKLAS
jgi:hypothetical protein